MLTLATILDTIKENYAIIKDVIERINDTELRDLYVPHSPEGMYYCDAVLLNYFINDIAELQAQIDSGDYKEADNYVD